MPTSTELFIKQNVFREYNGREIRVILLREDGLAQSMPSFLESIQNNITGLAPVYGSKCRMTHLAISSMTQVLIISLSSHTKNTGKKGNKKNRETAVPMLEKFLHDSTILKIALQMDKLASSLFFDYKVRIAKGKDLLSIGNPIHSRGSFGSLYAALSGGNDGKIDKKSVTALFANEESQFEPKMVALQAWTACYAISLYSSAKVLETPSINTTNFDALVLNVVAKNIRDMNRLISLKPNRVKHEVKLESLRAGELHAVSQRYKTKVGHLDGTQAIHITFRKGEKTANRILHSVSVQGRSAKLTVGGRLSVRDIQSVETIGREPPSSLEQSRTTIMLHALQGRLSLSNYPFVQTIWLPSKKVDWSELSGNSLNPSIYFPSRHLNPSQEEAVNTILSNKDINRVVLIHGPPGTGKTTVIAAAVTSAITSSNKNTTLWLVSQSNVAVKNIAEKLAFVDFLDFKIVVSKDYHFEWHEHLYEKIVKNVITSDRLPEDMTSASRELGKSRVILCTLSMLSNPRLSDVIRLVPLQTVIIDEASQIEIGNYFPMLVTFRPTLRKLVFIGDDKQLAPYGSSDISELESIFEKGHIRKKAVMLDTQCLSSQNSCNTHAQVSLDRMPIPIGNFISQNVYKGLLKSQH
ncbi:P-loop containing nucleoside triphosphate hydrolase protein, partial [Gymnopilus junonius]